MELIGNLHSAQKILAEKIAPKVYEHEFLKEWQATLPHVQFKFIHLFIVFKPPPHIWRCQFFRHRFPVGLSEHERQKW
jgi:hypothetical protein